MTVVNDSEFFVPKGIYFLAHSVGPVSPETQNANVEFMNEWKDRGGNGWARWLNVLDEFYDHLGFLLDGVPSSFCVQNNISSGLLKILTALPKRSGRNVLLLSPLEFPSISFLTQNLSHLGYKVKFLEPHGHTVPMENIIKELNDDVQAIITSFTTYNSSFRSDVELISKCAREKSIFSIVDIAQSFGVIPFSLKKMKCDFLIGSCLKWICGGAGAGFLWANENLIDDLKPKGGGWFCKNNIFNEDYLETNYVHNAHMFMDGTPSILPIKIACAALGKIKKIGIDNIYKHNQKLIDIMHQNIDTKKFRVISPVDEIYRGGTFVFKCKEENFEVVDRLKQNEIFVDMRTTSGVRVSPHIYNTSSDVEHFLRVVNEL